MEDDYRVVRVRAVCKVHGPKEKAVSARCYYLLFFYKIFGNYYYFLSGF